MMAVSAIASAKVNSDSVLDYQGKITHAVGNEFAKETLPCNVTIGKIEDDKPTFFFHLGGDNSNLQGTRQATKKKWNSNLVYQGPKKKFAGDIIRYEEIEVDIDSDKTELELNRKVYEYKEHSLYSATLSNVTCKAKLAVLSDD